MATYNEPTHAAEYLVSEANGARSRDEGVLAAGNLPAGAVLALNGDGDYVPLDPAGSASGTDKAKAILYAATDASTAPQPCTVHARACEVEKAALTLPDGITDPQTETAMSDLAGRGIIPR